MKHVFFKQNTYFHSSQSILQQSLHKLTNPKTAIHKLTNLIAATLKLTNSTVPTLKPTNLMHSPN